MAEITRETLYQRAMVVRAKKRLGQNFLIEPAVLRDLVDSMQLAPHHTVVEIGPGLGFLTEFLLMTGARVFAVELDSFLAERLENTLGVDYPNLRVVNRDFLHFELADTGAESIKVCGNVPYQITTPIIARVLGELDAPASWLPLIESLTMTVQYELASRITAQPGSKAYGQITALADYYCQCRFIRKVGAEHFIPKPNVESAIIELKKRPEPKVRCVDNSLLRRVVAAGFKERRKMLKNNLAFTRLSQEDLHKLLLELHISPAARAESLSLEKFAALTDRLHELMPERSE